MVLEGGQGATAARPCTGHVVLGGLAAFLLLALLVLRTLQAVPSSDSSWVEGGSVATPGATEVVHIVEPGETLWAIATELAPDADPRPIVDHLADRNGGAALQVGQRLVIPADLAD